jgi:signal transduction histidine kinase
MEMETPWRAGQAFLARVLLHQGDTPEQTAAFRAHCAELTIRYSSAVSIVSTVVAFLFWPGDWFIYRSLPDVPPVFVWFRLAAAAMGVLHATTVTQLPFARRSPLAWGTFFCCWIAVVVGATLGGVSASAPSLFHTMYLLPPVTYSLFFPLGLRIGATLLITSAGFAGYFLPHPEMWGHPLLGNDVSVMLASVVISLCVGHAIYHLSHVTFFQQREIESRARELEELSGSLARRIEERTADLRQLAVHVENLRETERKAISLELHDELGQLLTAMHFEVEVARNLATTDVAALSKQLASLDGILDRTMETTRRILTRLRPRVLDDLGLSAAVEWLVEDTRRHARLEISLRIIPRDIDVGPDGDIALFRVLQESLTNVIRHAEATRVTVELIADERDVTLSVVDDGKGLPPGGARRVGSFGVLGMTERLMGLGGTFEIAPRPGGGTQLRATLPASPINASAQERATG